MGANARNAEWEHFARWSGRSCSMRREVLRQHDPGVVGVGHDPRMRPQTDAPRVRAEDLERVSPCTSRLVLLGARAPLAERGLSIDLGGCASGSPPLIDQHERNTLDCDQQGGER
jgi:hypothetical protein